MADRSMEGNRLESNSGTTLEDQTGVVGEKTDMRMSKRQVLKRRFGTLSIIGFSCTILGTWEGVLINFGQSFLNGGTRGILGQYVLSWIGITCVFATIGELASMAPTAGGQYHWVAMLSPRSMRNFLSYLTGWMNILAWVSVMTTCAFWVASMTQELCEIDYPSYSEHATGWQVTLMLIAVVVLVVFFNTVTGKYLPHLEGAFLIIHILGYFGVLIPLVYYAPKTPASEVFAQPYGRENGGGWPTYGLSFMVGSLGMAVSFIGADAAVHMSEEINDAAINVPRSIFISIMLNGTLGLGMLIAILFCMGNPETTVQNYSSSEYPIINIFVSATNSVAGASVMTGIVIAIAFAATTGSAATASRMIWSFAHDRGLPFSNTFTRISATQKIPVVAVVVSTIFPCLLGLINIGSSSIFDDVVSLTTTGFYSTYMICCVLLLFRRMDKTISKVEPGTVPPIAWFKESTGDYVLTWGRWHVPGVFGVVVNAIAVAYLITIWFFAFWPPSTPTTAQDMNWACVVFGFTVLFSIGYWFTWGHRQYITPIVDIPT